MKIAGLQYSLKNKTLEIYLSGCLGICEECHNKELWDFEKGSCYTKWLKKIEKKIQSGMVNDVWILGGEPLDQDHNELENLLKFIKKINSNIWLWTRYELNEIPKDLINYCTYIKTGSYQKNSNSYIDNQTNIELASLNQKIYKI